MRIFQRDEELLDRPEGIAVFKPVSTSKDIDSVVAASAVAPVLLFLHDPYCPISSHAYEQVERLDATAHTIDVDAHSALGREVATRTGIRHQSPQAIVFVDGQPAWHASHGGITVAALENALAAAAD